MLYLVGVIEENYKVYDSSTEDDFMIDSKYFESHAVSGVVSGVTYTPFTKRELKLANLLEMISDEGFKKYSKSRFPVFGQQIYPHGFVMIIQAEIATET